MRIFAVALFLVFVSMAIAPEVVRAENTDWNGFYAGINGTFALRGTLTISQENKTPVKPTGPFVGVQFGYQHNFNKVIAGIETDFQFSGLKGHRDDVICPAVRCGISITEDLDIKIKTFGTVRGRLGLQRDRWMPYITGGYAYVEKATATANFNGLLPSFSRGFKADGFTLGGGIDYSVGEHFVLRFEYLHAKLSGTEPGTSIDLNSNIVRFGVNYRF